MIFKHILILTNRDRIYLKGKYYISEKNKIDEKLCTGFVSFDWNWFIFTSFILKTPCNARYIDKKFKEAISAKKIKTRSPDTLFLRLGKVICEKSGDPSYVF